VLVLTKHLSHLNNVSKVTRVPILTEIWICQREVVKYVKSSAKVKVIDLKNEKNCMLMLLSSTVSYC
jgi:hypothetical protein